MNIELLRGLLASVPSAEIHEGKILGGKPGLLAGVAPVCRLPEGPVGEAYGALIVGAVNALPALLNAYEHNGAASHDATSPYSKDLREMIEQKISMVLGMRPGAKASTSIWGRLIWTTIEPLLVGPASAQNVSSSLADPISERIRKERRDAVLEFTCFMLAQLVATPIEGEADVTKLFERWESEHNSEFE